MPGNDMFVYAHTHTRLRRQWDGNNNNIYATFSFSVSDFASISAVVIGTVLETTKLQKVRRGVRTTSASDYFNDVHMFSRQITIQMNVIYVEGDPRIRIIKLLCLEFSFRVPTVCFPADLLFRLRRKYYIIYRHMRDR